MDVRLMTNNVIAVALLALVIYGLDGAAGQDKPGHLSETEHHRLVGRPSRSRVESETRKTNQTMSLPGGAADSAIENYQLCDGF